MRLLLRHAACLLGLLATGSPHAAELIATADTWIQGARNYRTDNYGGGEFMKVRARGPRYAFIEFDTASLAPGAETGAMLSLHVSRVVAPGVVQIRPVTSAWSETGVTFDTRPTIGAEIIGTISITAADAGNRVGVHVSPLVASWITDPATNFGLAITAEGSTADVYFGTRDAGAAPELVVAATNSVTVSQSGGDYSDPVAAANNAFFGDAWCVNPTRDAPCTIDIDEGIYVLPDTLVVPDDVVVAGAGKTATVLVARPGLELAADAMAIAELTLINRQDASIGRAVAFRPSDRFGATLTRVAIRAEGGIENVGLEVGQSALTLLITESDIAAAGGQAAYAIDMNRGTDSVDIRMSRITATGATDSNEGITKFFDTGGGVTVTETAVVAAGGRQATGIGVSDEEGGDVSVTGGSVTASAAERASGISGGEVSQDLTVEGTRIIVDSAGSADGIHWYGVTGSTAVVSDVLVDSSDVAFSRVLEETDAGNVSTITRSQLLGQRRVIDIGHGSGDVSISIDRSVLRGAEWVGTAGAEDVIDVSDSILIGEARIEGAGIARCTNVLGGNYAPLDASCLPAE